MRGTRDTQKVETLEDWGAGGRWVFFSREMRGEVRYLDDSGHKGLADLTIPGNVDDVGDSSSAREELVADVQLSLSIYIHISPSYIFFCFEYKRGATIADFFLYFMCLRSRTCFFYCFRFAYLCTTTTTAIYPRRSAGATKIPK